MRKRIDSVIAQFLEIDFQLAYLVALTLSGVKPLGRWERELDGREVGLLEGAGLSVRKVTRSVRSGKTFDETVFSLSEELVESYQRAFDGTTVDRSAETRRKEGALLGYPECCTEHFIRKPYDRNDLDPDDQKILFHWACPGCERTKERLPNYRGIHDRLRELVREHR